MERTSLLILALAATCAALAAPAQSQDLFECAFNDTTDVLTYCNAGDNPLCMLGETKALVIFTIFRDVDPDDEYEDSSACFQWHEEETDLYPWMSSYLDSTCSNPGDCPDPRTSTCETVEVDNEADEPSLTDYFHEMSAGKFWLWGDVFPSIVRTPGTRSYYRTLDSDCLDDVGLATLDVLDSLDSMIDFSEYDRNPQDGYVDLIIMVYRSFRNLSGCTPTGFAWLQGSGLCGADTDTLVTNDSLNGEPVKIDLGFGLGRPSGVTLTGQNLSLALQQSAHEIGHLYFTRGSEPWRFQHTDFLAQFGVMDNSVNGPSGQKGAGLCYSAFERDRLGWLNTAVVDSTTLGLVLDEAFQGSRAVKIPLRDSTEYFLIENRAQVSWYDTTHADLFPTCRLNPLPKRGAAIYHVDLEGGSAAPHNRVDVEVASGLFELSGSLDRAKPEPINGRDTLDVVANARATTADTWGVGNANTFGTYTSPNTNRYEEISPGTWRQSLLTGVNVNNMVLGANDTLAFDVVFADSANHVERPATGAYTTKWDGWVYLTGDVVIDSLVTLQVEDSTDVKARYSYDKSAEGTPAGVDTSRIEVVVKGGGLLDVNGTTGAGTVLFTSTKAVPAMSDWYGIRLKTNAGIDMNHTEVSYGLWGISATASTGAFVIDNSRIRKNGYYGIYAEAVADTYIVRDSAIHHNGIGGISFTQKKSLTGTFYMHTKIVGDSVYANSISLEGGNEIELWNLGGTGVQIDSLRDNAIGFATTAGSYGLYSDGAGNGGHRTFVRGDTVANFTADGVTLAGLGISRVESLLVDDIDMVGLVIAGVCTVRVADSRFGDLNWTHVWNDETARGSLGDNGSGGASPGRNAFEHTEDDTVEVWNWHSGFTLKAENNWWDYAGCDDEPPLLPPTSYFYGTVDRSPFECSEPELSRPFPGFFDADAPEIVVLALAIAPNPSTGGVIIAYDIPGSMTGAPDAEVAVYAVSGRRVARLAAGRRAPGRYVTGWDLTTSGGERVAAGVYYVRFAVGSDVLTKKLVLAP